MYWDTKFAIRGRIEELAARLNCDLIFLSDDFDDLKAIQPSENLPDLKSRFQLFSYVGAPGDPYIRILSTEPSRLQDLAALFHWLALQPDDITCETGSDGKALVDIPRLRRMIQAAGETGAPTALKNTRRSAAAIP